MIGQHKKIVLQLSGGKDSIACLLLLQDKIAGIDVAWLNTGSCLPETLAHMEKLKPLCKTFHEIKTDSSGDVTINGYPCDILPIRNELQNQYFTSQNKAPLQSSITCCFNNIMRPMHEFSLSLGATLIIRGQKRSDIQKSPVKNGQILNGVQYWYPVNDWTDQAVLEYVEKAGLLPKHYKNGNTSLDCWHCTGHMAENKFKIRYLEKNYPHLGTELRRRVNIVKVECEAEIKHLSEALL